MKNKQRNETKDDRIDSILEKLSEEELKLLKSYLF